MGSHWSVKTSNKKQNGQSIRNHSRTVLYIIRNHSDACIIYTEHYILVKRTKKKSHHCADASICYRPVVFRVFDFPPSRCCDTVCIFYVRVVSRWYIYVCAPSAKPTPRIRLWNETHLLRLNWFRSGTNGTLFWRTNHARGLTMETKSRAGSSRGEKLCAKT